MAELSKIRKNGVDYDVKDATARKEIEDLKKNGTGTGNPSGGNVDQSDSVFKGKTASFYGDSLTEVNYHYTKGYHSWVKDLLGLASYKNYGVSGFKVSDVYNKVNSVNDTADVIFVMCGVNDQNFSVPLGDMGDSTTGTTYGALNLLCSLLKQKYPTKLVVFITPHYQTKYPHNAGITSYEVSKAIREVCEKYAIPIYDNFVLSGIYSTNLSEFTTDNCHWNDTAHEMVGKNLARFMMTTFQYIYGNATSGGDSGDSGDGDDTHVHSYTKTVTTAATCETAGVRTCTCSCGHSYTEEIPAIGHNYVDGVCSVCGEELTLTGMEVKGTYMGAFHLSLYVSAEDLPAITNEAPVFGFTMEPLTEFVPTASSTGGMYAVDTVNNLTAGYTQIQGGNTGAVADVVDMGDGTYSVIMTQNTITFTADRAFWCFPIKMSLAVGYKFNLTNAFVNIGDTPYNIHYIGGAFSSETLAPVGNE